ncbi:hypothetical protein HOY80DRAFT_1055614 [Tuber brumale]|nr:hypothetical protein HOY80DRAFT_1055614 [Tuber brumale]
MRGSSSVAAGPHPFADLSERFPALHIAMSRAARVSAVAETVMFRLTPPIPGIRALSANRDATSRALPLTRTPGLLKKTVCVVMQGMPLMMPNSEVASMAGEILLLIRNSEGSHLGQCHALVNNVTSRDWLSLVSRLPDVGHMKTLRIFTCEAGVSASMDTACAGRSYRLFSGLVRLFMPFGDGHRKDYIDRRAAEVSVKFWKFAT